MNFVNTYLLLPLQRKIFKNFGHYDYQTSTFHLNEERVNEVFFDPAYNPFVDVLRATSHASAVASSKAATAAAQQQQQCAFSSSTVRRRNTTSDVDAGLSASPSPPSQSCSGPVNSEAAATKAAKGAESNNEFTAGVPRSPPVRLLRGKIRSAGLVSFLRQVTTQKSLSVESMDLVFDVATAAIADSTDDSHTDAPSLVTRPAGVPQDAEDDTARQRDSASVPDPAVAGLSVAEEGDDAKPTQPPLYSSRRLRRDEMAKLARSYSIEDHSWLHIEAENQRSSPDATGADFGDLDADAGLLTADGAARPASPKEGPATQFHTVGDLMTYLKQQLQGVAVGVEEVRLTFCIPPVGAAGSLLRSTDSASRRSGRPHAAARASAAAAPLRVLSGTRVLHLSCRRGLRFTVDESTGASVEDMQCTASIQDWQCYVHVMASDGPLPSEFSLDDLVFTTSTALTAGSAEQPPGATARDDSEPAAGAPFTVRVARRGAGAAANAMSTSPSPSLVSADAPLPPPRVLVDVDAAEGWSIVLSAVQIAHLVAMMKQVMGDTTDSDEGVAYACSLSSFSSAVEPASTAGELAKQVAAVPLDSDEAVTAATLTAAQLRAAAKYVSVHCGGCSISLLTRSVVDANAVACAWRCALSSQQLALLDPRATAPLQQPTAASTLPVYEALTTPHFTYVMRDADILFPNIDAEAPLSLSTSLPTARGVFQQSARKRKIYRRIFDNKLADPAVTEQLARARTAAGNSNGGGVSFFLGVGSISFLEYRHATAAAGQRSAASSYSFSAAEVRGVPLLSPLLAHSLRPAKLMHAERSPYALVIFHRSTPPLPDQPPAAGVLAPPPSPCLRIYQETVVVGVAKISVQLDAGLVEVLAMYGTTVEKLIRRVGGVQKGGRGELNRTAEALTGTTGLSARRLSSPPSPILPLSPVIRTRSSVKVLLESVDASIRFPIHPNGTTTSPELPPDLADGVSASTASPASAAAEPQSLLLARLLQRLRESSFDTHRHNRALLRRRARQAKGDGDRVAASPTTASAKLAEEAAVASAIVVQEQLGFPEDVDTRARFLPELLSFSLRDLQVVHTPSATTAARGADVATPAAVVYTPASTSVKWREAVVYLQDILEQTNSELFRVDYSHEMNINVTHTSLPGLVGGSWRALERVLALQIRLGEITTTALTQDDYLLATHYVNELLLTLSRCRQRLRAGKVATAAREPGSSAPPRDQVPVVSVASVRSDGLPAPDGAGAALVDVSDESRCLNTSGGAVRPYDCREEPVEHPTGSAAEAFAMADAVTTSRGLAGARVSRCAAGGDIQDDTSRLKSRGSGDGGDSADPLRNAVPELWRLLDTTCTSLDVRVSRIRLGLFAPRLSPMGQVVGEPLYRCLPRSQRRCLVDLNCLYHLYIMELVDVSVRGLSGDGAFAKAGQANYARVRLGGFSLWERQPAPAPPHTSCDGRGAGGGAGAAAASPLYKSYVSNSVGSGGAPPVSHGLGGSTCKDLAYYMRNSQAAHLGHRRAGTLVQLVQSYAEVRDDEEEGDDRCHRDASDTTEGDDDSGGQWVSRSSRVLSDVWGAYVRELQSIATTAGRAAHAPLPTVRESGVCEVRLLEMARVPPIATAAHSCYTTPLVPTAFSAAPVPPNRRHLWLQLTGLGLHHAVAYNGDHLAAVLKQYFSGGDGTVGPAASAVRDGGAARGGAEGFAASAFPEEPLWTTKVHVDVANLMATYRPRGAGRSLAVLLLPRASVLIKLPAIVPASAEAHGTAVPPEELRRGSAAVRLPATSVPAPASEDVSAPLTMRAQAWLHTSLPLYVCNDCDVEALVHEVLNPAESDDWGVDLESAGFVRLCEVISTAACSSSSSFAAGMQQSTDDAGAPRTGKSASCSRTPNLILTVRSKSLSASASGAHGGGDTREEGGSVDYAYLAPAVSMHLQHIELSAFMAKDSFEVFRELVEAWGSGTDLKATDAPAALVMRSGPGFEWVAEEVARSCAPMTFRVNPYLVTRDRAAEEDASSGGFRTSPVGAPMMRNIASVDDYTSHYPFLPSTTSLQASSDFESPWTVPEKSQLGPPTGVEGYSASHSALRSSASAYGYSHWLDTLHASYGRDPQLYDTYQTRAAELLDGAPWVPQHQRVHSTSSNASGVEQERARCGRSVSPLPASSADAVPQSRRYDEVSDTISVSSDDDDELTAEEGAAAVAPTRGVRGAQGGAPFQLPQPPLPSVAAAGAATSSLSSSFSDLEDTVASEAQLRWCVLPSEDPVASSLLPSGDPRPCGDRADSDAVAGDPGVAAERRFDLFAACDRQPHFLSCWSRERVEAARQRRAVRLNRLDCTDDALLHDTPEKYLYPPVELEFFLSDCSLNLSLYEGTDLMSAAVRKQRRGYLQIVSRGASLAQAAPYVFGGDRRSEAALRAMSSNSASADTAAPSVTAYTAALAHDPSHLPNGRTKPSLSRCSYATSIGTGATWSFHTISGESSTSRLERLHDRGCRSGFGDRDASKRLVLSCRGITVQMDTFPQGSEEDLWFHVVVGEATVFDCINTSDVHRLLTATPKPPASLAAQPRRGSGVARCHADMPGIQAGGGCGRGGANDTRHLELTGLLTSSKSVLAAASGGMKGASRASFTVSHFQQGGSELSLAVRLRPTSLTWSGASVDFAQAFFSTASASPPSSPANSKGAAAIAASSPSVPAAEAGTISGTEAPPLFYRRVVILPTTLTAAGSFQSDKGVLAALAEGNSFDALRSIPVLSWISLQEIPLPIPFIRVEDCSSAATLLQRIVEDSNCVSIRFLLTACCCGLQPLSAVTRVGEAAKGLLLLPLSNYRGAALHHAIRTASSVFMQELLTQASDMAALLASGSYHASRSLLEVLVAPQHRGLTIEEPSRASQPAGVADGWRQGQEQLRVGLQEALTMASYCTGPDGSLLRVPAAALRLLMGVSGAATTTLWGVRNSQGSVMRERDGHIYKKKSC
ncbi:conserved hypothetical protein [Leishmania major strain Friedlin]|uniref:Autophagy-related protein 2 n=1 Tax=Leishmania major TaxID=5664 RepID=E9AF49_LEIMA|nr:conserved hypothetical protein [Leishmania major strain Friedlin]CAG9582578.1 hypothetical_protein_-_conserved [Leishmania major strain Friedlin]CBZ12853.1 conserved hypothetical protein [Leishmania major strain Friedlin]|eukprot:XP_003722619.1 conserved hypothetical protein [Leishmania major strain Friedlin]